MSPDQLSRPLRILIADSMPSIRNSLETIFLREGYEVRTEADAKCALITAQTWPPDILIADMFLTGELGVDLAQRVTLVCPRCRVIIFAAQASQSVVNKALSLGFDFVDKPIHPVVLIERVKKLLTH